MKTCFFCKGDMLESTTTHVAELNNKILVIRNVPCLKCSQCGEVVYSLKTSKRLEEIIKTLDKLSTEISILNYENVA